MKVPCDSARGRACWVAVALVISAVPLSGDVGPDRMTAVEVGPSSIRWAPRVEFRQASLVVRGNTGRVYEHGFGAGASLTYSLVDQKGNPLPDGDYRWELTLVVPLPGGAPEVPESADEAAARREELLVDSDRFGITGGRATARELRSPSRPESKDRDLTGLQAGALSAPEADFHVDGDLTVSSGGWFGAAAGSNPDDGHVILTNTLDPPCFSTLMAAPPG